MKEVQWIWAGLCLTGIVILGLLWESEEAECRARDGLFCFDPGFAFGVTAFLGVLLWGVVALVLWITNGAMHWWARRG